MEKQDLFDFRVALTILKQGGLVLRQSWFGSKGLHMGLKNPSRGSDATISYFYMEYQVNGKTIWTPWMPSNNDILSEDWMEYKK